MEEDTGLLPVSLKRRGGKMGTLKKGLLKKVGYRVTAKTSTRRRAVRKAIRKYGRTSTLRKLNAVSVLTRRTSPAKSKVFRADMKFVQKQKE